MKATMFTPVGIGVVAEHKPLHSKVASITPIEDLKFLDGEIKENVTSVGYKGTDSRGEPYEGSFVTDNTQNATWLPYGANRRTAPNLRRGMRVMLYRMGEDNGKAKNLYWRYLGLDDDLMRLETVIFAISATQKEDDSVLDISNTYFFEVSSHQKHIMMHTSAANGEPFEYLFNFDTGNGDVVLKDDINNQFHINSGERIVELENADGTRVSLIRRDLNMNVPDNLTALIGKNVKATVGGNVDIEAKGHIRFHTGATTLQLRPDGTLLQTPKLDGKR